ncbi:MAG: hypothetical protein HY902_02730 [Deltaproteobacteria bacterium]|nr:hypothetical protein [Deltaproteobacteria bacterium]
MRIIDLATVVVFGVGALACQPQTLDRSALNGTVSSSDAADSAGGSDVGPDTLVDSLAGDVPDSQVDTAPDQAGGDGDAAGDGVADSDPADTAGKCIKDTDCPAKPCQKGSCTAAGCTYSPAPDQDPCDDGNSCLIGDHCEAGECKPGKTKVCDCLNDQECIDQSNVCTGPMICDPKTHTCEEIGKGTKCPDASPSDCLESYCDPSAKTAKEACKVKTLADLAPCNDGIACTLKDVCQAGKCVPKENENMCECLDSKTCQDKAGNATDLCNGIHYCDEAHTCKKTAPTVCDPGTDPCVVNTCNPKTGKCTPTPKPETPIACSDGNGCTTADVCEVTEGGVFTGKCQSGTNTCKCTKNADCANKEDGDVCNGTLFCNKLLGECQINPASIVTCQTALDTVCEKHVCNKVSGVCETLPTERLKQICPVGKPDCGIFVELAAEESPTLVLCDDGNPCTAASSCKQGQCAAEKTAYTCKCQDDGDCAGQDDGDLCNGILYCNKSNGTCEVNPASVVVCPTMGDTQCAKNVCNPKTGVCEQKPQANGPAYVKCEDGNPCTAFDYCQADGSCHSGPNTCVCVADKDCASKEDGDLCNGTMFCNKATGACEVNPATVKFCTPQFDNQCRKNTCQPTTGECVMVIAGKNILCEDGNPCTVSDTCAEGECTAGPNTCVCNNQADCGKLEDGNLCNGTLYCDLATTPHKCKVNPATLVSCPAGLDTACLINTCDPATGSCVMQPPPQMYAACDDGNPCTTGDVCIGSVCESGANICGCTTPDDCKAFDDGNPCNGAMSCLAKLCAVNPSTVVACEAGDTCTKNVCEVAANSTTTCKPTPVLGACDDKNPCTSDACAQGTCSHQAIDDGATPCSIGALAKVCVKGLCVLQP